MLSIFTCACWPSVCLLFKKMFIQGTSLAVQWLRLCTPTGGGVSLIPGWGTKISHAMAKKKSLFKSSAHFLTGFIFLMLSCMSYLYILDNFIGLIICKYFSHSVGCLFILSVISFAMQKAFKFN